MRAAAIRGRVLDWKFLAALAFLLMVAYLVIGGYTEQVAKGRRIDHLIAIGRDKDRDAEEARRTATVERAALRRNQERLLALLRQQARRQAALGKYLQDAGVTLNIPPSLLDSSRTNKNGTAGVAPRGPKTVRPEQKPAQPQTSPKPPPSGGSSPPPDGGAPPPQAPRPNPVQDLLDDILKGLPR